MEQRFKKEMESLEAVFEFLGRFMEAHRVDQAAAYALSLAVEEFFTNMVKYDARNNDRVTISAMKEAGRVKICLVNDDVDPFDVTRAGEVDVTKPLEARKVGGLGIYLARSMVDELNYEYSGRTSTITLIKKLEK